MDEKTAVTLALVLRHSHDARNVVLLLTEFLFGKVADEVTSFTVVDSQHVEKERLDIVVECLMVEEEFGQQAQILAVYFVDVAIHLEDRKVVLAVNLSRRRVPP